MYKLCVVVAMCCAFSQCGSAAQTQQGEGPRSQLKDSVEQDQNLQEVIDGQENILSKVGGCIHCHLLLRFGYVTICCVKLKHLGKLIGEKTSMLFSF